MQNWLKDNFYNFFAVMLLGILFVVPACNEEVQEDRVPTVKVIKVSKGSISTYLEMSTTVKAQYFVDIYSEINGKTSKVLKNEGDKVKKDDVLVLLNDKSLKLDIENAQLQLDELIYQSDQQKTSLEQAIQKTQTDKISVAELKQKYTTALARFNNAKGAWRRATKLLKDRLTSKQDYQSKLLSMQEAESAKKAVSLELKKLLLNNKNTSLNIIKARTNVKIFGNKIEKARLSLKRANRKLKKSKITAPIAGVISFKKIQAGQKVQSAEKVFSIVDLEHLQLNIGIPQYQLLYIKKGQPVQIFNEILPLKDNEFKGIVKDISPVIKDKTAKVTIAILKNYVAQFRPGMFITVRIIKERFSNVTLVHKRARLFEKDEPFVFLLQDQHVKKVFIGDVLGISDRFFYQVLGKIKPGDLLVVGEHFRLKDGQKVRAVSSR